MVFKNVIYLRIVILYFKMRQIASVDLKDMKTLDDTEVWFRLLIHSIYNTLNVNFIFLPFKYVILYSNIIILRNNYQTSGTIYTWSWVLIRLPVWYSGTYPSSIGYVAIWLPLRLPYPLYDKLIIHVEFRTQKTRYLIGELNISDVFSSVITL